MDRISDIWSRLWAIVLDNRSKLTTTGGFLAGILVTLAFKDFYPDLEATFQHRMRRLRGIPHPFPGQPDHVRLEDHTRDTASLLPQASSRQRRGSVAYEEELPVGIEGLIGHTPLIKLQSLSDATGCEILAKAEFLNGAGNSPKDRVALAMITSAESEGILVPHRGDTIYEGTVGSTGISLAAVCRARGYKAHMYVGSTYRAVSRHILRII